MHVFHVIKDPVHGTMQFTTQEDGWIKPFIDSPSFQRLRHIKQLGMGDYIFPGAVHTRFNHCLGCCYVASQIAHKIGLSERERQLVMIACLLHDIGHGPFSHAFEDLFYQKMIHHEDWTPYFLAEYHQESFVGSYNQTNPKHPLDEQKLRQITDIIMHQMPQKNVLADIVSSQLDADRLDYLLRDGHFCGVRYGEFDFRWMLHCMAIVEYDGAKRLGITHKGIGVVEHYLMARRLMMRNIYQLQKKLAFEAYLVQLLNYLAQSLGEDERFDAIKNTPLGQFLMATHQLNDAFSYQEDPQKYKQAFLATHYQTYQSLSDDDVYATIKMLRALPYHDPIFALAERLMLRKMPKIVRLEHSHMDKTKAALQDFKLSNQDIADWQLTIIQTPLRAYSAEIDPIFVINEHGLVKPIGDFSFMIKAISDQYEHTIFLSIDSEISERRSVKNFLAHLQTL